MVDDPFERSAKRVVRRRHVAVDPEPGRDASSPGRAVDAVADQRQRDRRQRDREPARRGAKDGPPRAVLRGPHVEQRLQQDRGRDDQEEDDALHADRHAQGGEPERGQLARNRRPLEHEREHEEREQHGRRVGALRQDRARVDEGRDRQVQHHRQQRVARRDEPAGPEVERNRRQRQHCRVHRLDQRVGGGHRAREPGRGDQGRVDRGDEVRVVPEQVVAARDEVLREIRVLELVRLRPGSGDAGVERDSRRERHEDDSCDRQRRRARLERFPHTGRRGSALRERAIHQVRS